MSGTEALTPALISDKPFISSSSSFSSVDPSKGEIHESLHELKSPEHDYCKSGSITPSTQGRGKFNPIDLKQALIDLQKTRTDLIASEESEEKITKIMHSYRAELELSHIKAESEKGQLFFTIEYRENIGSGEPQGSLVKRFGINPKAVEKAAHYGIAGNVLHFAEKKILDYALQELESKPSAEESEGGVFAHNVVVVDIFAREGGRVKVEAKTNLPETHAIVLWKKSGREIVLIDPNKCDFSQHIANALNLLHDEDKFSVAEIPKGVIYSSGELGHSEYADSTPKSRDCIDIAIKMAFEINEQQYRIPFTNREEYIAQIIKRVYEQISNKSNLNKAVTLMDGTFIRQLQSTQREIRESANKVLRDSNMPQIWKNFKLLGIADPSYPLIEKVVSSKSIQGLLKTFISLKNLEKIYSEQHKFVEKALEELKNVGVTDPLEHVEELIEIASIALKKITSSDKIKEIINSIEEKGKEEVVSEGVKKKDKEKA